MISHPKLPPDAKKAGLSRTENVCALILVIPHRTVEIPATGTEEILGGPICAICASEELSWSGGLTPLADPQQFAKLLAPLYQKEWATYAKPPHNGPEHALKYLARYTYRVAISNERIESLQDSHVTFRYKAYAHGHRLRQMTLAAQEFLRRFDGRICIDMNYRRPLR
jgi:hypothetical protein